MRFLALAVIVAVAQASSVEEQWLDFKLQHGKTYKSMLEEQKRFQIFQENVKDIEEHNKRFDKGEVTYFMGINQFTDMTQEEFEATLAVDVPVTQNAPLFNGTGIVGNESINWVTKGYVTEVKQQGACGSCWAFSAAGAMEGQVMKNSGVLKSLSAQNLLDCAYSLGCDVGGNPIYAFQYAIKNGVLKDTEYAKYDAVRHACKKHGGQKLSSFRQVSKNNEKDLLKALTTQGPISALIDSRRIKQYNGGIFGKEIGCSPNVDHAILIVGAGSENDRDYWLVKNSWGTTWGEKGYFRIARGENACAISSYCTYPVI